jgi:broad specificity phosphatase PhoE
MATELNDQGRLRAQALVEAATEMNITAIYSPDLKRNLVPPDHWRKTSV